MVRGVSGVIFTVARPAFHSVSAAKAAVTEEKVEIITAKAKTGFMPRF
jgi:hypothetical protein